MAGKDLVASVRIDSLGHGPHALARVDGKVHLVRGGAPGDLAELEVTEDRGRFAYARIAKLLEPGPDRRDPPCRWLPECGGCSWQHLDEAAQLSAKEANVRESLSAFEPLRETRVEPIIASPDALGYRRRLSLRVQDRRVGFFAGGTHELVAIEECLLAVPALDGAIETAGRWVHRLTSTLNRIEVVWNGEADHFALVGQCDGALADGDRALSEALLREEPRLAALVLHGRGFDHVLGQDRVRVALPGAEMWLRAGGFSQVNDGANQALVRMVLEEAACTSETRLADLYAGAGNFSIALAGEAGQVVGIERERRSIESLRMNADRIGLKNLEGLAGHVHRTLRRFAPSDFDTIVLDPPRSGAADAVPEILRLAPRRIVYVSCNPATLARDLAALAEDYVVDRVMPIDLFPQTPHVETVARLTRRD